jgi:hypothetical protein
MAARRNAFAVSGADANSMQVGAPSYVPSLPPGG